MFRWEWHSKVRPLLLSSFHVGDAERRLPLVDEHAWMG